MTRCGSRLTEPSAETTTFSCVKDVDDNGQHLDGNPLHVDESGPDSPFKYRAEWTDLQADGRPV